MSPSFLRPWCSNLSFILRSAVAKLVGAPLSDRMWLQCFSPTSRGGLGLSDPCFIAEGAYISSCFTAFKFWSSHQNAVELDMSGCCLALADMGAYMGSTSEACLALAHNHNFGEYISLQPFVLQQHWWVGCRVAKAFRDFCVEDSARDVLRSKLLYNDHGSYSVGNCVVFLRITTTSTLSPWYPFVFCISFM